jgi:hypothetical protein
MHKFLVTVNKDGVFKKYHAIGSIESIQNDAYDRFGVCGLAVIAL